MARGGAKRHGFASWPIFLNLPGMPHGNSHRARPPRIGVFPGQFDPITNGHLDIIRRGSVLFDELIVAVGINPEKREMFTLEERVQMIGSLLRDIPGSRVARYSGLTVDFVRQAKATAILRGIRDASDLRYEFQLALANRAVGGVETVFIMTGDQHALTSSSLIRQVVALGVDVRQLSSLLPDVVIERLQEKQRMHVLQPAEPDAPAT
jgi:pantetheine-phosphate adenylyltransferase